MVGEQIAPTALGGDAGAKELRKGTHAPGEFLREGIFVLRWRPSRSVIEPRVKVRVTVVVVLVRHVDLEFQLVLKAGKGV